MSRVVVTGAAGFVGRHVVASLEGTGADVVAIRHRWVDGDDLDVRLGADQVDSCVHLGWYAAPADYRDAREANVRSLCDSMALVDALAARGCRHVVVAGTSAEYGPHTSPVTEDERPQPRSAYGACKGALAMLLDSSWRPAGMGVAWARLFNMTGAGEQRDRLVPVVTRSLLMGNPVDLSPGGQVRDFLDVRDVAAALVALSLAQAEGTYNVCSGRGITLHELLTRLATVLDGIELLRFGARVYTGDDPYFVVGDNTRLRRSTPWEQRFGVEEMLRSVVEYWRGEGDRVG